MSTRCLSSFASPGLVSLSLLLSYSSHSSSSTLNQTVTGGQAASRATASSPPRCLFLCSVKRTVCQGAPCEFPAPGSDPILLGRARQCEFFTRLKLSGGREFTFRTVNVGQGHPRSHSHIHMYNMQSKTSGQIGLASGSKTLSY